MLEGTVAFIDCEFEQISRFERSFLVKIVGIEDQQFIVSEFLAPGYSS